MCGGVAMNSKPTNTCDSRAKTDLESLYRQQLLEGVIPFWEVRTADREQGGYLTCFDRTGNLTDDDKYIWFQGRQLYMFSALYRQVEKRPLWLELAQHGRNFIVAHAYAGGGRWHYQLDREKSKALFPSTPTNSCCRDCLNSPLPAGTTTTFL